MENKEVYVFGLIDENTGLTLKTGEYFGRYNGEKCFVIIQGGKIVKLKFSNGAEMTDSWNGDFKDKNRHKVEWLEAQPLPLQECYVPKLAPEETPLREDQLDYIKAGQPFVFESTGRKKGWFYSYRDESFCNQHSEVYPTEEEALKKYFERLDLKLSLPLKEQELEKFLNSELELGISDKKTIERVIWYYKTYFKK